MKPRLPYVLGMALGSMALGCGDDDGLDAVTPPKVIVEAGPGSDAGGDAGRTDSGVGGPNVDLHIPGLTASVRAVYDEFGFLHVSGKTDEDAFAAVGYFHAANRFFFMDYLRHAIRGTLGSLINAPGIVDQDVTSRTFFATPQGDPLPEKLVSQFDAPTKAAFDAYARGVNAWLADMRASRNGASLTAEYGSLSKDIRDWEPADSTAVALFSLNDLSNNANAEISLGRVAQTALALAATKPLVANALQSLFLDFRPTYDAYTIPAANTPVAMGPSMRGGKRGPLPASSRGDARQVLAMANERLSKLPGARPTKDVGDTGSNNWVISGSRAAGGRPLLANDPHLTLTNPSIWFPVEIDGKTGGTGTYHAVGGSFPGIPSIQTGHNESIAWGVTVAYWDMADVYLEKLTGPNTVLFNGANVAFATKTVDFVDQGKKVMKTLAWVPHHGPIVSIDAVAGTAVTIRWRGHDGSSDGQAFLALGRAGSIAEAKTALANITTANQNFVVADKAGSIGYFPYAKVPTRPWAGPAAGDSPFFPLSGLGTREWGPPVAIADIPQLVDPPAGFIATANGDITGAFKNGAPLVPAPGTKPIQTTAHAEGTRLQRILDSIKATGGANTVETMRLLQGDTRSLVAETIVPRLVTAAAATPAGGFALDTPTTAIVNALKQWQTAGAYTCPAGLDGLDPVASPKTAAPDVAREALGCAAFHVALYALFDAAFGDELKDPSVDLGSATNFTNNAIPVLVRSLRNDVAPPSETFWIDVGVTDHFTTRTEILQRSLTKAGAYLTRILGANADDWRWGKFHTLTLRSPLAQLGLVVAYDTDTYAAPGGLYTVNVANPSSVNLDDTALPRPLKFAFQSGPSIRTLIEVGTDTPHLKISLPGGADLHRGTRFYNNLLPNWVSNTPVDFAFGAGAVKNPAVDLQLNP